MATIILGNNKCSSPYDAGTGEAITIRREGVPVTNPVTFVGFAVPTNFLPKPVEGVSVTTEAIGYVPADANGVAQITFNASPTEEVLKNTAANGYLLPAGVYNVETWLYIAANPQVETAQIEIIGDAATAIAKSTRLRGKKK